MNLVLNILGWTMIAVAGFFLWRNIRNAPVSVMPETTNPGFAKDLCDAIEGFSGSAVLCFDPALKFISAGDRGNFFIAGSDGGAPGHGHLVDIIPAPLAGSFSSGVSRARDKGRESWEFLLGGKKMLALAMTVKKIGIVVEIKDQASSVPE